MSQSQLKRKLFIADETGNTTIHEVVVEEVVERPSKKARLAYLGIRQHIYENVDDKDYDSEVEEEWAGPPPYRAPGIWRDERYYDETLPDDHAYVVLVEDILFRVKREDILTFSSKLAQLLESKLAKANATSPTNNDSIPLEFDDDYPHEWRAMLDILHAEPSERMAPIQTLDQLHRMLSFAIMAYRYDSIYESDAMALIYQACLPEHVAELKPPFPSSILTQCTPKTFYRLMRTTLHVLRLFYSHTVSATDPLISPIPVREPGFSPYRSKPKAKPEDDSRYPPFYKNLPTVILRHWIASLMPEAAAWALPLEKPEPQMGSSPIIPFVTPTTTKPFTPYPELPQVVTPTPNIIFSYSSSDETSIPDLTPCISAIISSEKLGIPELRGAAGYTYLRGMEMRRRLSGSSSSAGSKSIKGKHGRGINGTSAPTSSTNIHNLLTPSPFNFHRRLTSEQITKILQGQCSLAGVWENLERCSRTLVPSPGSGSSLPSSLLGAAVANGIKEKGKGKAKATISPKSSPTKNKGKEKERKRAAVARNTFKAPSMDSVMDWESGNEGEDDASSVIPGAFPFSKPPSSPASASAKGKGTGTEEPYVFGKGRNRPFRFSYPTASSAEASGSSGGNAKRNPNPLSSHITNHKSTATSEHHDHANVCIPSWEYAFALAASSPLVNDIPKSDLLSVLAAMIELLTNESELSDCLGQMDEGCRSGALENLREVREGVRRELGRYFF
ncbi:hypothetical protein VKT23_007895 [Stygiomarasmius scandens]|uniref:BTB domain-containing protein n=1 Tax=Marasmiellus scandens TaxID=2682957 RepID=A0ABR1JL87_9AGAR